MSTQRANRMFTRNVNATFANQRKIIRMLNRWFAYQKPGRNAKPSPMEIYQTARDLREDIDFATVKSKVIEKYQGIQC